MELGQLRRLLMGDDFRIALENDLWPGGLAHVKEALKKASSGSYSGTLTSEISHQWGRVHVRQDDSAAQVSEPWLAILRSGLSGGGADNNHGQLWHHVLALSKEAAVFTAYPAGWRTHPPKAARNSLALISSAGEGRPAVIRCIATRSLGHEAPSVWLGVQFFKSLSPADQQIDPYRANTVRRAAATPHERFYSCYAELEDPTVVPVAALASHVGYTPYLNFSAPAAVATVLCRVSACAPSIGEHHSERKQD